RSADCSTRLDTTSGARARRCVRPGTWTFTRASRTSSTGLTRKRSGIRRSGAGSRRAFALLQAVDATFGYGDTPVLHGVSLEIPAGALVGLIGPNGAGKTTLLRLLAGTRRPSRGQVLLDGSPLTTRSRTAIAQRIAVVPQDSQLAFDYTALEVVLMGRYAHLGTFSVEGPADLALARAALRATGVEALEGRM